MTRIVDTGSQRGRGYRLTAKDPEMSGTQGIRAQKCARAGFQTHSATGRVVNLVINARLLVVSGVWLLDPGLVRNVGGVVA